MVAESGHQIHGGNKAVGIAGERLAQCIGVQVVQQESHVFDLGPGRRAPGGGVEPGLFGQPVLVVGFSPAREVVLVEAFAGVTEVGDDGGVREAVEEHEVDLVANGLREAGDFAGTATTEDETGGVVAGFGDSSWERRGKLAGRVARHFIRE